MEPIAAVPLSLPQFVLQVMLILLAGLGVYLLTSAMTKIAGTPVADKFINPPFVITVLLLALVGFVLYMVFLSATPASNDVQVMVITAVVVTGLQEIRKYWLNSTSESEAKNVTIAQQARTNAVTLDSLLDPNVTVTGAGDGRQQRATMEPAAPASTVAPPGAPIQTANVTVNTVDTKVNEIDPKAP